MPNCPRERWLYFPVTLQRCSHPGSPVYKLQCCRSAPRNQSGKVLNPIQTDLLLAVEKDAGWNTFCRWSVLHTDRCWSHRFPPQACQLLQYFWSGIYLCSKDCSQDLFCNLPHPHHGISLLRHKLHILLWMTSASRPNRR